MIFPKPLLWLLALGLLGGCAAVQQDLAKAQGDVAAFTQADLTQAIALAMKATDPGAPYRLRCYETLRKYVLGMQSIGQLPAPSGLVSGYEVAAELDARGRGGLSIPPDVHADCAVIITNLEQFAIRFGVRFAPIPGGAAIGNILPR